MKALQDRVNIIPVIAKADTLTPTELGRFKQHVIFFNTKLISKFFEDNGRHE